MLAYLFTFVVFMLYVAMSFSCLIEDWNKRIDVDKNVKDEHEDNSI